MNGRTLLFVLLMVAAIAGMARCSRDPHRTALPFGSTDLSSVQAALQRLPEDERALVEAYVERSNGDVLPPAFADPDDPLTARTFGEAIELQRAWNLRRAAEDVRVGELHEARQAKLQPLRALVGARVVQARISAASDRAPAPPGVATAAVDSTPHFETRIAIDNRGDSVVVGLRGSLRARDRDEHLPLDLCYIELGSDRPLPAGGRIEVVCRHTRRGITPQQQAFVDAPPGRFTVEWEPRHIRFEDGREIDSGL